MFAFSARVNHCAQRCHFIIVQFSLTNESRFISGYVAGAWCYVGMSYLAGGRASHLIDQTISLSVANVRHFIFVAVAVVVVL